MSDHRSKLLQDWTLGDWQDEAKAQREARETAEHQLHEARTQVEKERREAERLVWKMGCRIREDAAQLERCREERDGSVAALQEKAEEEFKRANAVTLELERCQEARDETRKQLERAGASLSAAMHKGSIRVRPEIAEKLVRDSKNSVAFALQALSQQSVSNTETE